MSSTSSTTPSSLRRAALLALLATGCATSVPAGSAAAPEGERPAAPVPVAPPAPPPAPVLNLEYGNLSTKATFQVDLSGTDVHVELVGRRAPADTGRPAAAGATGSASRGVTENVTRTEEAVTGRARLLADSALRGAGQNADSTTARVVAAIRKAQEYFYQGRYSEASDAARRAISIRPTAEAHALAGSISWVRKEREDARLHWLRARELDPAFPGIASVLDSLLPAESAR